jgi:hypothetical protein
MLSERQMGDGAQRLFGLTASGQVSGGAEDHYRAGFGSGQASDNRQDQHQFQHTRCLDHQTMELFEAIEFFEDRGGVFRLDQLVQGPHQKDDEHAEAQQEKRQADPVPDLFGHAGHSAGFSAPPQLEPCPAVQP